MANQDTDAKKRSTLWAVVYFIASCYFWVFDLLNFTRYSVANAIDTDFDGFSWPEQYTKPPEDRSERRRSVILERLEAQALSESMERVMQDSIPLGTFNKPPAGAAVDFDLSLAVSLAVVAKASYESENGLRQIMLKTDFAPEKELDVTMVRANNTCAFVVANASNIIIVFRERNDDTPHFLQQVLSIFDYLTDFQACRRVTVIGRLHHGFLDAIDLEDQETQESLFSALLKRIKVLNAFGQRRRLFLTGHSLGGAMATCFAAKLMILRHAHLVTAMVTFGSPMVGDAGFKALFDEVYRGRVFRVALGHDIVTHLPPSESEFPSANNWLFRWAFRMLSFALNYHHVGTPVVISKDSQMLFEAVKNQSFRSYVLTGLIKAKFSDVYRTIFEDEPRLRALLRIFIPSILNDHFPGDYLRCLRSIQHEVTKASTVDELGEKDGRNKLTTSADDGLKITTGGGSMVEVQEYDPSKHANTGATEDANKTVTQANPETLSLSQLVRDGVIVELSDTESVSESESEEVEEVAADRKMTEFSDEEDDSGNLHRHAHFHVPRNDGTTDTMDIFTHPLQSCVPIVPSKLKRRASLQISERGSLVRLSRRTPQWEKNGDGVRSSSSSESLDDVSSGDKHGKGADCATSLQQEE